MNNLMSKKEKEQIIKYVMEEFTDEKKIKYCKMWDDVKVSFYCEDCHRIHSHGWRGGFGSRGAHCDSSEIKDYCIEIHPDYKLDFIKFIMDDVYYKMGRDKKRAIMYYKKNKKIIKQNRERIILCECGKHIQSGYMTRHKKRKLHIKRMLK